MGDPEMFDQYKRIENIYKIKEPHWNAALLFPGLALKGRLEFPGTFMGEYWGTCLN